MQENSHDADWLAMQRLQSGEDIALNELMQRWKQPLTNYLFRQVGHELDSIELAQETFVKIYNNRHGYQPKGRFCSWMFSIATNLAKNHLRWRARHPSISTESSDESSQQEFAVQKNDASDEIKAKEQTHAIQTALNELPDDLKTTVLLFEYENMSHNEIAEVMECSHKTVESRLYKAREKLRIKLSAWLKQ